jgi:predicted aldo/keto reductase-like oxidoreductase
MHGDAMKRGVEACHKAGIGLTAMKTQGGGPIKTDSDAELKLAGRFVQKGFTPEQAKLKAVWENEMISAVCSQMPNITIMTANVAAAIDKSKLTAGDFDALKTYAEATCSSYCAGCSHICDAAVEGDTSIAEVMRYMMYHQSYRETHLARQHFAELPEAVRANLAKLDFSAAEQLCPQKIAIGEVMKQALEVLG